MILNFFRDVLLGGIAVLLTTINFKILIAEKTIQVRRMVALTIIPRQEAALFLLRRRLIVKESLTCIMTKSGLASYPPMFCVILLAIAQRIQIQS